MKYPSVISAAFLKKTRPEPRAWSIPLRRGEDPLFSSGRASTFNQTGGNDQPLLHY
jgi:hypothetical protein